ncbi:hypothetical protein BsWGS_24914 [Bradybaena similaris]
MAGARPQSNGRLTIMRSILLYLSLLVITILISGQFWDWYRSGIFLYGYGIRKFPSNESSDQIDAKREKSFALYEHNSTDSMPSVCEFPSVDPYDPSVMKVAGLDKETLHCEGMFLPDLTYIHDGNELRVNTTLVEECYNNSKFQHCRYQQIFRHETDDHNFTYSNWSEPFKDKIKLPESAEFFKVECTNNTAGLLSKTFYYLIPKHTNLDESDAQNLRKRQAMAAPKETLSVIMIAMDTLNRYQFFRAHNKTYSYLMNSLKSFDLTTHSQLGLNTFPNFLPLFVGQSQDEIKQWWSDTQYMDNYDLLWGIFEKAGYRTLYTEDWTTAGAFHSWKKGFRNKFARYNSRPLGLAMSADKDIWKKHPYCAGNQLEMNFLLGYLGRFLDTFSDKPVFAVAMISKPTHDRVTDGKMVDEHMLQFYQSLNQKGHLNRSLLISLSDHGPFWGPIKSSKNGNFESKTPYTILTFPDWFLRKYPDVAANLQLNTKRLTTHFDTHATLLDLLYFKSSSPPLLAPPRPGISLFEKIPWDRTCMDASIPLGYCLCGYKGLEELQVTSDISQSLANLVIIALNSKIDKTVCADLKLLKIIRVLKIVINVNNSKLGRTLFKVQVETTPGNALFEANVYTELNSSDWKIENDINRLNLYKGQNDCTNIAAVKPYCYCKNLLVN